MDHTTQTLVIITLIALAVFLILNRQYKKGAYYQVTKNSYFSTKWDTGKHGEYLIYKQLKPLERIGGKFLFNLYIPKKNGKTTELDVLLICPKGIFVFESKNYSGWIYGNESQRSWTQTLLRSRGRSRRLYFYNPVKQNQSHIRHLKKLIGDQVPMRSMIVFSNRCTLKKISVKSANIHVIYRHDIRPTVAKIWNRTPADLLTPAEIEDIYNKLYPYTQVSDAVKEKHIANIEKNHGLSKEPVVAQVAEEAVVEPAVVEAPVIEEEPVTGTAEKTELPMADADTSVENTSIESENTQPLKCPRCGGTLVLRTAKRGQNAGKQFYGCEGYPKCRYVEEVREKVF